MQSTKIKNFWETCDPGFSHIEKDFISLKKEWDSFFVDVLNSLEPIAGKVILDYGIGAAYLGQHLHSKFGLDKYIGIDISDRQLSAAKKTLDRNSIPNELYLAPKEFSQCNADIFICQAVIQHFPDMGYFTEFFNNLNRSNIPVLCLQYRYGVVTSFKEGEYLTQKDVCRRCHTNETTVSKLLSNYTQLWVSDIKQITNYQFIIFRKK